MAFQQHKSIYLKLGHCELVLKNQKKAIKYYKKSLDLGDCAQNFYVAFMDDFQYLEPQGVTKENYQTIKEELQQYCSDQNSANL